MNNEQLERYWQDIPTEKELAVSYAELMDIWQMSERGVRSVLHELSRYDNGDGFIIIRSGRTKGFYKTNSNELIEAYRREVLKKGKSIFAPLRKINRVLGENPDQIIIDL